jgi:hypothetical protein
MSENKLVYAHTNATHPPMGYVGFVNVSTNDAGDFIFTARTEGPGDLGCVALPRERAVTLARAILSEAERLRIAEINAAERADDAATGLTVRSASKIIARHYGGEYIITIDSLSKPDLPPEVIAAEGFIRNHCEQEGFGAFACRASMSTFECKVGPGCHDMDRCDRNGCIREPIL